MSEQQQSSEAPVAAARRTVLLAWSSRDAETRIRARALAARLSRATPRLDVIEADLPELMGAFSVGQTIASLVGSGAEAAVLARVAGQALEEELRRRRPTLAVALDPTAAAVLRTWRQRALVPAPLVGIADGLHLSSRWYDIDPDRLLVLDEPQAEAAQKLGVERERALVVAVEPAGLPVDGDKHALRDRFGIDSSLPLVLVDCASVGDDTLTDLLFQLSLAVDKCNVLFDTGQSGDETRELLRSRAEIYGVPAQMFGDVPERDELWAACDVVIGRPRALLERRAIAADLAILAYLPEEGEETARSAAYEQRALGRGVTMPTLLSVELEHMVAREALELARRAAARVREGQPVGEALGELASRSDAILAESVRRERERAARPAKPSSDKPEATARAKLGPLESIGPGASPPGREPGLASESLATAARRARAERNLREMRAQEELDRIKREQLGAEALRDYERGDAPSTNTPAQTDKDKAANDAPQPQAAAEPEGRPVGLDPTFKKRSQKVEDELAALKKKMQE
ncbi:MAG: hypothetical protein KC503_46730 [Myxococcales bacterium]|nr:hypothetical protein [Myxococcales bacterium]